MAVKDRLDLLKRFEELSMRLGEDLTADEMDKLLTWLLYTSDDADERSSVDLGGRRHIKKKNNRVIELEGK